MSEKRTNKMPLKKGAKPGSKAFKENIAEMVKSGHPINQSVAAAYSASKQKKKRKQK